MSGRLCGQSGLATPASSPDELGLATDQPIHPWRPSQEAAFKTLSLYELMQLTEMRKLNVIELDREQLLQIELARLPMQNWAATLPKKKKLWGTPPSPTRVPRGSLAA